MKFAYEDLSEDQFEKLIVLLCQRLLGMSVKGFAKGPDGGRDAKFVGTAELHPSKAAPWIGTVIVQAKHTNGYNRHFGEADFYSPKSQDTVMGKEVPRIAKLRNSNQLDHYMLFANRRLAGNADENITQHISKECGLPEGSIYLCGLEQLELYMKQFSEVPALAELDPVDSPLIVSPDELAVVVEAIASHDADLSAVLDMPPSERTSYEEKNERQREFVHKLQQLRADIRTLAEEKTHLQAAIEVDVEAKNADRESLFSKIRLFFNEIVEDVIDLKALLSVVVNQYGHLDFRAELLDDAGIATSADRGFSYKKLLCIAFDLALLRAHLGDGFPRFAFHDGLFESLDDRKKENLLGVIRRYTALGLQSIITLIDSDLPPRADDDPVFDQSEIVVLLHDEGDTGRLFKMKPW